MSEIEKLFKNNKIIKQTEKGVIFDEEIDCVISGFYTYGVIS